MNTSAQSRPIISLVAALSENRIIGRGNQMPWHLPDDLKFCKRVTLGKPMLMGRNTFTSIGKPLPGRMNVVLTSNVHFQVDGVTVVHSMEQALAILSGVREIMIIGGGTLYRQWLPDADRLYLTQIRAQLEGDVFFPDWQPEQWRQRWCFQHVRDHRHAHDFDFVLMSRRKNTADVGKTFSQISV